MELPTNVKFYPFESYENLGHYEIHKAKVFEAILEEIIVKSIEFSSQQKCYNFDSPVDMHELNGHVFGFFNAMHLMYSEKTESETSNQEDVDETEEQNFTDLKKHMSDIVSYKHNLKQNVSELTSNLTNSVSSATESISKTVSSAFKLNSAATVL